MPCGCADGCRRWLTGPEAHLGLSGVAVVASPAAHWLRRLLWAAILAVALFWLIVQVRLSVLRLQNQALTTTSKKNSHRELPFPAVTVCAGKRFKPEQVLQMTHNDTTIKQWQATKDVSRYRLLRWREFDFHQFFARASHTWRDLVQNCSFQERPCEEVSVVTRSATSQLGTCFTLRQNGSATGTWTKPQLTLKLRIPEEEEGEEEEEDEGGVEPGWHVLLHPDTLQFSDAAIFAKDVLTDVRLSRGSLSYVRMHRRIHRHISTEEEPCSDDITAEEHAACIMQCIVDDARFDIDDEEEAAYGSGTDIYEDVDDTTNTPECLLPWEELETDAPCRTYSALKTALRSSPDLGAHDESDILSALVSCDCPFRCTATSYPAQSPEKMPLRGTNFSRSAQLALWLSMDEETQQEEWTFSGSQLVAECGGNLGIFLGASALSVVELLDMLVFLVIRKMAGRGAQGRPEVVDTLGERWDGSTRPAVSSIDIRFRYKGNMDGTWYKLPCESRKWSGHFGK